MFLNIATFYVAISSITAVSCTPKSVIVLGTRFCESWQNDEQELSMN